MKADSDLLNMEIDLLLIAIKKRYGYDFQNYGKAHIKRRVLNFMQRENIAYLAELQRLVLYDENVFHQLLLNFSINVTELFRDPEFYKSFIENVVPTLKTYPYLKFWHAGCATGEEVYSMAILLWENELYKQSQIYATDFNQIVLEKAKNGIYPIKHVKEYIHNYRKTGLNREFSEYYAANHEHIIFNKEIKQNTLFTSHNLVNDGVFGEMNVIVCRNVLIYFDRNLQNRVFGLFHESLVFGGFLCLGTKENMEFSTYKDHFELIDPKMKIYKKIR